MPSKNSSGVSSKVRKPSVSLAVGTAVGAFLSFILFSFTVVGLPLLLDREIDVVTAIVTSFRAVLTSAFERMNLVSREEFEARCEELAQARAKLENLQQQLDRLRPG